MATVLDKFSLYTKVPLIHPLYMHDSMTTKNCINVFTYSYSAQ